MAIKPFNSVAGFSVGKGTSNVILGNGDILANNFVASGNSTLGPISNVTITGGNAGQYLRTDGNGNLSFATLDSSGIANGTSNIAILANGNVNVSASGNANVLTITGNSAIVNGTLTANYIAGELTTDSQPNITSLGTLTSLSVSGNVSASYFIGNGSQLTGIDATAIQNGSASVRTFNNANVAISAGATSNVIVVSSTQTDISGNVNITGALSTTGNVISATSVIANQHIYVGNGAQDTIFNNPTIIAVNSGSDYVQAGLINTTDTGSADWVAYGDNGNDIAGWSDFGFTGSNFNDPNYTITGKNDGYFIVQPVNGSGLGGNLVLATGDQGANRDIVFATGGFLVANEKMRLVDAENKLHIKMSSGSSNTTTGALVVDGGLGAGGNINSGGSFSAVGNISGANILGTGYIAADRGLISVSTYNGPYFDGIVVDYEEGNARFSTGASDGFRFFNNGIGNVNIVSIDPNGSLLANGNIQSNGNLYSTALYSTSGGLTLGSFAGNNSLYLKPTGTGTIDANSARITSLAEPNAATDAATKNYVDTVAQGLAVKQAVVAATTQTLAATTGGIVTYDNGVGGVGATLTTTGAFTLIDTANVQTVGSRILVKNEANSVWNGIYSYANSTSIVRTADFDNSPGVEIAGAFVFVQDGDTNKSTGWVCTNVNPVVVGTSPISFTQFSGAGTYSAGTGLTLSGTQFSISNTTVLPNTYGSASTVPTFTVNQQGQLTNAGSVAVVAPAGTLTGNTLNSTITHSNLTTVGTLNSLSVANSIDAGNISVTGTSNASQFISTVSTGTSPLIVQSTTQVANLNAAIAGVAGYVSAAAQPNITSLGNLLSLKVDGNATFSNINTSNLTITNQLVSTVATGTSPFTVQSTTRVANLNVAYANVSDYTLVTNRNTGVFYPTFSNVTTGNASLASNVNINVNLATGTFNSLLLGGTLTTSAQPNITSVGTLSNLAVSNSISAGSLSVTGNISTTDQLISTASTGTSPIAVASTTLVANLNADLLDGYDSSSLATSNTVAIRDSNANITANYFIGNGSQLTGIITSVSNVVNGTSNINIAIPDGNVTTSVNGVANVLVVTSTGANLSGTMSVGNLTTGSGGNIIGANLISANFFTGTLTTAAQPNITSVGTLGNLTVGNLISTTSLNAIGNITAQNFTGVFANGTSNISIPAASGNINISAAGNANVVTVTGSGANINGTLTVSNSVSLSGTINVSGTASFSGATFNHSGTTSNITASASNVVAVFAGGVTASGNTKTVNIGTSGLSGSNTTITVGSPNSTTTTVYGETTFIGNIIGTLANGNSNISIPTSNGNILLTTAGSERIRIDTSGNVGIGTSTPIYRLDTAGTPRSFGYYSTPIGTPATPTTSVIASGGTLVTATYYFKIVAVDALGNLSTASAESTGAVVSVANSSITVSWTATPGAVSYRVYYATSSNGQANYYTSTTNSYTLTATSGTAGSPPLTDATGSMIVGNTSAASVKVSSTPQPAITLAPTTSNSVALSMQSNTTFAVSGSSTGQMLVLTDVTSNTLFMVANTTGTTLMSARSNNNVDINPYVGNTTIGVYSTSPSLTVGSNTTSNSNVIIGGATYSYITTSTTATTAVVLDTYNANTFASVDYFIQASAGGNYQSSTYKVISNGTAVLSTEYGRIFTSTNPLVTFTTSMSGNVVQINATPSVSGTTFKIVKTMIGV